MFIVVYRPRNCSLNWWAACCLFIICLSLSVFPSCNTVSVKNGWPMLYWQPAKCCVFQLFIIICYLANKVLLLLRFFQLFCTLNSTPTRLKFNKLCGFATICPAPCKLTFDLLTLKVVSGSRVTWPTSVPILVFLGLSVLDLEPVYATDVRRESSLNASGLWARGHNNGPCKSLFAEAVNKCNMPSIVQCRVSKINRTLHSCP